MNNLLTRLKYSPLIYRKFDVERMLSAGKSNRKFGTNTRRSVLFFTTHKCASTYMKKALAYINEKELKLTSADLANFIWTVKHEPVYEYLYQNRDNIFRPNGYFYSPLRRYVELDDIGTFDYLLMLRDPRDILVSSFYSETISHPRPANNVRGLAFDKQRTHAISLGLDKYVVERAPILHKSYQRYKEKVLPKCKGPVLRYEDLILDFDSWVDALSKNLSMRLSSEDIDHLYKLGGFGNIGGEDQNKHIRKVTPGDFREKLKDQTILTLNSQFSDTLSWLNLKM